MRLAERLNHRVKDLAFDRHVIVVRSGRGDKDWVVMLPRSIVLPLRALLARSRALWSIDRMEQRSRVYMAMCWQWLRAWSPQFDLEVALIPQFSTPIPPNGHSQLPGIDLP